MSSARPPVPVVWLLDVDDTLLDNDRIEADLRAHIDQAFGEESGKGYWKLFESERGKLGYADYLGALQAYRNEVPQDARILELAEFLIDYPFAERLYPRALDVLARLGQHGTTVILTDGDVVLQPRKVVRSGIAAAVDHRVMVYVHKEKELDRVRAAYPAERYVMIDDKAHLLAAFKGGWGERVTTVLPQTGHYAHDPKELAVEPRPDVTIAAIAALLDADLDALAARGGARGA